MQQRCIPTKKSNKHNDFYLLCSAFAYPYGTFAFELQNSLNYDKEKNQNRKQQIANKNAVESLRFQTHYGLKVKGYEEGDLFQQLADIEVDFISELGLTQDILDKRCNVCHPDAYPLYY